MHTSPTIGGVSIDDICNLSGTPVYVYDTEVIARNVHRLNAAFAQIPARFMYAAKALSNSAILRLMKKLGTGLDTVSIQEVHRGLRAGFAPSEILFTPNMISFEEIREAVSLGVHINIDTISVLERFGHEYGNSVPVCIRVNPHIMAGGNERISTGHIDSKFGISIHQMRHVLRVVASHGMHINGLHMHTGSDILDADVFLQGAEMLFEIAESFPDLEFVDFGSGFKVPYKPDVVKQTTSTVFAGVETGLNHLIRPMLYNAYHHITNASNPSGTPRVYTVVGYICETDTFGWDRKIAEIREGDVLAFANAGAYGMTMASNYNSRLRPAEVLVHNAKASLIRRRETLDDILATEIDIDL
jgi:diaminopimelate decarboxylase